MPGSITLSTLIPAPPDIVYSAWLDSDGHTAFTGSPAQIDARVGGRHTAWDGYISGATLELLPGSKIVQSWRAADFPEEAPDSRLEVHLSVANGATRLTLIHTNVPDKQLKAIERGWHEFYFEPMTEHFAAKAAARAAAKAIASGLPPPPEPKVRERKAPKRAWGVPVKGGKPVKPAAKAAVKSAAVEKAAKAPVAPKAVKAAKAAKPAKAEKKDKAAKHDAGKKGAKEAAKKPGKEARKDKKAAKKEKREKKEKKDKKEKKGKKKDKKGKKGKR
jgi:uncharacterized protein YndB with AHSA1/START domain